MKDSNEQSIVRVPSQAVALPNPCSFKNNMFIFPGVGLGVISSMSPTVPDRFFFEAANALANCVDEESVQAGKVSYLWCPHPSGVSAYPGYPAGLACSGSGGGKGCWRRRACSCETTRWLVLLFFRVVLNFNLGPRTLKTTCGIRLISHWFLLPTKSSLGILMSPHSCTFLAFLFVLFSFLRSSSVVELWFHF